MSEQIKFYMITSKNSGRKTVYYGTEYPAHPPETFNIKEIPPETTIGQLMEELNGK